MPSRCYLQRVACYGQLNMVSGVNWIQQQTKSFSPYVRTMFEWLPVTWWTESRPVVDIEAVLALFLVILFLSWQSNVWKYGYFMYMDNWDFLEGSTCPETKDRWRVFSLAYSQNSPAGHAWTNTFQLMISCWRPAVTSSIWNEFLLHALLYNSCTHSSI